MSKQRENNWTNCALRIVVNTASHPLEYAKVLIQLGHEPILPRPTVTFFGRPALKLPNIFEYVKYIKSVDGLGGCYRGLAPKVCGNLVSAFVSQKVSEYVDDGTELDEEEADEDKKRELFVRSVKKDLLSRVAAIIVGHPFHVITIRMMAQFIGGETKYCGVIGSIVEIYKENGVLGFFGGVVPRTIGDVISLVLASSLAYAINTYVFEEKELQVYTSATMSFIASAITYPFQLVSNCMVVSGCNLAAGNPPYMPAYPSWIDCWSDLSKRNQLKRGSSLLIRYYVGPQIVVGGKALAVPQSRETISRFEY